MKVLKNFFLFHTKDNLLFDDINKKISDNKELRKLIKDILLQGKEYTYAIGNDVINIGVMFGLFSKEDNKLVISNRIFEVYLYNKLISEDETDSTFSSFALMEKNIFIVESNKE